MDFSSNKYERIIVIDAKADSAVSIYPFFFVIRPEWGSNCTIIDQILLRKEETI